MKQTIQDALAILPPYFLAAVGFASAIAYGLARLATMLHGLQIQ